MIPKLSPTVTCTVPLCRACLRGKGRRTQVPGIKTQYDEKVKGALKVRHLELGDQVSTYQFECRVKCRLPHSKGKEYSEKMYSGGTIFVDHASQYINLHCQVSLGTSDTIRSKELHELRSSEHGIHVKL